MIYYLILINIAGFISMLIDKYRSTHHLWRISEKTLLLLAVLGGSIGSYIGMQMAHHKVSKKKFSVGIPLMIILQILILTYLLLGPNKSIMG
nr:DUF1294 domain-containing protein [Beduini massiliensis]